MASIMSKNDLFKKMSVRNTSLLSSLIHNKENINVHAGTGEYANRTQPARLWSLYLGTLRINDEGRESMQGVT